MKFLLILSVVLLVIWLWRSSRPTGSKPKQQQNKTPEALEMVPCTFCSVHVPAADAIQGKHGSYCSADHLHRAEH